MSAPAKWLIVIGLVFIAVGLLWQFVGRFLPLGRLPGDIYWEKDGVSFFFPITTSIIVSIVLSLLLTLLFRLR
ncbi:MAG: DUF2905 domain-containing protein [Hydrogenibacillus sp.]|nr:DUF2905 domain-containing protein [Hydrogenibacillus sp.]